MGRHKTIFICNICSKKYNTLVDGGTWEGCIDCLDEKAFKENDL